MLRSDCHPTRSPDCGGELGGRGRLHVFRALDEGPPGRGDGLRLLQALLLSRNIEPAVKRQAASASVPKPQPLNLFIIYFETLLHSWAKASWAFVGKGKNRIVAQHRIVAQGFVWEGRNRVTRTEINLGRGGELSEQAF